ncbi:hypothetical protein BBO99_00000328 [Phytophthora kernoviae]|uniref:Calponin-homology (CH) domain-containing protein n=2 Tax=Phytophthora kernoviae TaxID=325452 RepID=A0A3R7H3Y4_9STRA|nr:hypothetical protein G195_000788 [Phytophthora kernoviae 00238/432]KAG2532801.1 hypothetical protein JM16_000086 [Phytophthora kernoviae]KAG2533532.1 hypothetical protein JM18_000088 [Phytophthora kernoviae]RLN11051.1 hypothetical protein BBI17_000133 [Phytophthora kernoviae]RLN86084.1 hypothetical protein BBO99_00000328 [Phytophthora kernoviae]
MDLDDELATGVMLSPTRNMSRDGEIVRRWMEMVLGDKFSGDLPAALYSGELLCDLVNKLYKALGMKSQISPPDDLLQVKGMEKVYSNVLSLQAVAVSLSNRRSIDERSSMINASDWSPMLEQSVFIDEDDLEVDYLDIESPDAVTLMQQSRWQRLLFDWD